MAKARAVDAKLARLRALRTEPVGPALVAELRGLLGDKSNLVVAEAAECSPRTIENALSMNTLPEAHLLGNILRLEPTALWEWLDEIGFKVIPKDCSISPDMKTAREMSHALTVLIQSLDDGFRDHTETLAVAKLFRALIPKMAAIVSEADQHRVGGRK